VAGTQGSENRSIISVNEEATTVIRCRACGAENKDGAKTCRMCAATLGGRALPADRLDLVRWVAKAVARGETRAVVAAWRSALSEAQPDYDAVEQAGDALAVAGCIGEAVECYHALALARAESADRATLALRKALDTIDASLRRGETEKARAALDALLGAGREAEAAAASADAPTEALTGGTEPLSSAVATAHRGPAVAADDAAPATPRASLVLVGTGGSPHSVFALRPGETVVGRADGDIRFPQDFHVSGRHARVVEREGHYFLADNGSRNGTFIRIHKEVELCTGDVVRVGKQLLRFDDDQTVPYGQTGSARLTLIRQSDDPGGTFPLRSTETKIGSAHGDIRFPNDPRVSDFHARIVVHDGRYVLSDEESEDGTFVKLNDEVELAPGDELLVGYQRLRFELSER
jgi:pSer/pThr/pTyr-binding forkhead associated (FHA) protein